MQLNVLSIPWSPQLNQTYVIGQFGSPRSHNAAEDGHYKWRDGCTFDRCPEFPRGRYLGQQNLGSGTYGKVFQCLDQKHNMSNAIKVVRKGVAGFREAALKELEILRHLGGQQGTVKLLRSFEHDGHICMSFDLLGPSIKNLLENRSAKALSKKEIPGILRQLLVALEYIHDKGVIHTDLKTDNILLIPNSPGKQVKLIDFGSSIFATDNHNPVIGTHEYRSPEAILQAGWSYPTDVWSLGCIIAEMHLGKPLFCLCPEDVHLELMKKVLGKSIPLSMISRGYANTNQYNCNLISCDMTGVPKLKPVSKMASTSIVPKIDSIIADSVLLDLVKSMFEYEPVNRITAKIALQRLLCSQLSQLSQAEDADISDKPASVSRHTSPAKQIKRNASPGSRRSNGQGSESQQSVISKIDKLHATEKEKRSPQKVHFSDDPDHLNGASLDPGSRVSNVFERSDVEIPEVVDDIHEQVLELLDDMSDPIQSDTHSDRKLRQNLPKSSENGCNEHQQWITDTDNGKVVARTSECALTSQTDEVPPTSIIVENAQYSRSSIVTFANSEDEMIPKRFFENSLRIREIEVTSLREELKQLQEKYTTVKQQLLNEYQARKDEAEQVESKLEQIKNALKAKHEAEIREMDLELRIVRESLREAVPVMIHNSKMHALNEELNNMIPKSRHSALMDAMNEEIESRQKIIDSLTLQNAQKQEEVDRYLVNFQRMNEEHEKLHKLTIDMMVPKELYDDKVSTLSATIQALQISLNETKSKGEQLSATIQTLQTAVEEANSYREHQKNVQNRFEIFCEFISFIEDRVLSENEKREICQTGDILSRMERIRKASIHMVPSKALDDCQTASKVAISRLQQRNLDMASRIHQLEEEVARVNTENGKISEAFQQIHLPPLDTRMADELQAARQEISRLKQRNVEMAHRITILSEQPSLPE